MVSIIERVGNSRSYFKWFLFLRASAPVRNNGASVRVRCPQGESWMYWCESLANANSNFRCPIDGKTYHVDTKLGQFFFTWPCFAETNGNWHSFHSIRWTTYFISCVKFPSQVDAWFAWWPEILGSHVTTVIFITLLHFQGFFMGLLHLNE